jgi:hypothetical protein
LHLRGISAGSNITTAGGGSRSGRLFLTFAGTTSVVAPFPSVQRPDQFLIQIKAIGFKIMETKDESAGMGR